MKKSFFILILSGIIIFALTGCESNKETSAANPVNNEDFYNSLSVNEEAVSYEELSEDIPEESYKPEEIDITGSDENISIDIIDEESGEHYHFRNDYLLEQHYEKHGIEMGFESEDDYEEAACLVINNPDALYKTEAEDGDGVYYVVDTNEFVILSTDGYIRTYFEPNSGIKYFERQ